LPRRERTFVKNAGRGNRITERPPPPTTPPKMWIQMRITNQY
jgi:hypothetical protein